MIKREATDKRQQSCTIAWVALVCLGLAVASSSFWKGSALAYNSTDPSVAGTTATMLKGSTISRGYRFPPNKQGIHDQRFYDQVAMTPLHSPALAAQRYAAYASEIQPGARLYNVFWQPFENSGVLPSDVPLTCPPGYSQVPSSADELRSKGYNHYHCYSSGQIALFQAYLALDAAHAIESAAVIWDVPDPPFRLLDCSGQKIHGVANFGGCIPQNDTFMLDFQDFVNFLAEHYNSNGERFTHYIIWNEVANGDWFDASPFVDNQHGVSPSDSDLWLDLYALMMRLAHDAIARHYTAPTMLYVSLDQIWERPPGPCPPYVGGLQHCHLGSANILRGLWQRLGIDIDWSVVIHPYGNPLQETWPTRFHFVDIERIAQVQVDQLRSLGVEEPHRWPQAQLAAAEQGWLAITPEDQLKAAAYICAAHSIVTSSPHIVFVTHNDFQATSANDTVGLVPRWTGRALNNTERMDSATFAAYASSHPGAWNVEADHYCCQMHQLGCQTSPSSAGQEASALAHVGASFAARS